MTLLEKGQAALEKARADRQQAETRIATKQKALAELQERHSVEWLGSDHEADSGETAGQIARLRIDIEGLQSALPVADRRIVQANAAVQIEIAAEKRRRAEELRKQAATHQVKTSQLLAQLREHEHCEYVPAPPVQPETGGFRTVVIPMPKSNLWLNEAVGLEHEARAIESSAEALAA